jgi:MscS family membrane protein
MMETFNNTIKWLTGLLGTETWIIQVFIVVLAMLVINYAQKKILQRLLEKAESTKNTWDDALLSAMMRPLSVLVWVLGLTFAADIIYDNTRATIFEIVPAIRDVGVIISIMWFLVRFIRAGEENVLKARQLRGEEVDRTTVEAIGKLLRLSVIITGVLVVLQTLGFSISGVLAFGGIGGIAVGFAAKDLMANFFGGLMIYLDRPFTVGDWVRSPDKEIEGTVENIGWRLTRIRTFDKRPLYVPNSVFTSIAVENPSRMTNRRIYETIGIRYDDASKMDGIVRDVKAMLKQHPEIDTNNTLIVNFNKFAPSSLDFFVYTFTRTTEWVKFHEIKQDVLLKILDIIDQHGAEVAFPTSTLHLASQPMVMPSPPGAS